MPPASPRLYVGRGLPVCDVVGPVGGSVDEAPSEVPLPSGEGAVNDEVDGDEVLLRLPVIETTTTTTTATTIAADNAAALDFVTS
jgi:hypothetical protein